MKAKIERNSNGQRRIFINLSNIKEKESILMESFILKSKYFSDLQHLHNKLGTWQFSGQATVRINGECINSNGFITDVSIESPFDFVKVEKIRFTWKERFIILSSVPKTPCFSWGMQGT